MGQKWRRKRIKGRKECVVSRQEIDTLKEGDERPNRMLVSSERRDVKAEDVIWPQALLMMIPPMLGIVTL